jgi:hypothetical protein
MVKDYQELQKFERSLIASEKPDYRKNFRILEEMYQEALELGIFPLKNPLDGIEVDIKIAKVVNSVQGAAEKNR